LTPFLTVPVPFPEGLVVLCSTLADDWHIIALKMWKLLGRRR
jgi:hypothetical protein